ncbi:hypothetical protein ACTXG5_22880 [Mycobacterium sp. Dal123C01]|uniref:hypothetical protein n=1 Tax=Mycobacterium sp. Dal123C01 TaxID=3457577 RepID=UPI00403EAA71
MAVWDGAPTLFLAPTSRGAILWWEFDVDDDESRYVLLAHVTGQEAQTVFDAAPGMGAIEPIRNFMTDNRAVIARRHPSFCTAERFVFIPRQGDEESFTAFLDAVHDELAREELPHPEHVKRRKRAAGTGRRWRRSDDSLLDALAASVGIPA